MNYLLILFSLALSSLPGPQVAKVLYISCLSPGSRRVMTNTEIQETGKAKITEADITELLK